MILMSAFKDKPVSPIPFSKEMAKRELSKYQPYIRKIDTRYLSKRVYNRMIDMGMNQFDEYLEYFKSNRDEIKNLMKGD